MMLNNLKVLLVLVALISGFTDLHAQNAKKSKARAKEMKKHANKHRDPYEATYHDKDSDGDGVPDGRDKCIHTPKGEKVTPFGCPFDNDFDGLYNYEDSCVDDPGPKANHGCPWADKDNDGIMDNEDKCPEIPGIRKFHGCPDTDGDGIEDHNDRCPKERGTEQYHGCPPPFIDSDGDGVSDYDDLCPDKKGLKTNRGCPEVKKAEMEALKKAFDNLLFETGKDVIMHSSYTSLDELAAALKANPQAKLYIEGHTDNVGEDYANMQLSENRARAVKNYLISKGVNEWNFKIAWYGETHPVTTNDTEEGRRLNRRVELQIFY
jgi:OmpA-OmpF porin, OOP family